MFDDLDEDDTESSVGQVDTITLGMDTLPELPEADQKMGPLEVSDFVVITNLVNT